MVKTIRRVWLIAWDLWQHRNDIEHANDAAKEKAELDRLTSEEIDKGHQNSEAVEQILGVPDLLDIMSKRNNDYKRAWLKCIRVHRDCHARRRLNDRILQGMRNTMRSFLDTTT